MLVLGIETSCDETAAAVVEWEKEGRGKILSNIIRSQIKEHSPYGGIVPEIAARAHIEILDKLIKQALKEAKISVNQINAIAATAGPGLIGGLIVGLMTAKAIALAINKPFIAVNHLEGHALTVRLTSNICFPYLLLLISGGHTQTVLVRDVGNYELFGTTIDDALGEAFDKTAKLLGLGWPGGPALEKMAESGDSKRILLPCPLKGEKRLDFSFSGLKTAVRQAVVKLLPLNDQDVADICASFQAAVADILTERVNRSMLHFHEICPQSITPAFVVAGGVAANKSIRSTLKNLCICHGFRFVAPPVALCTDNAAMIAWAGAEHLIRGRSSFLDIAPRARWQLNEK